MNEMTNMTRAAGSPNFPGGVKRKEVTSMTSSSSVRRSRLSFYSVCHQVNDQWHYVRAFTKIANARKLAKLLKAQPYCQAVAIWDGQPGGVRVA